MMDQMMEKVVQQDAEELQQAIIVPLEHQPQPQFVMSCVEMG